MGAVWSTTTKEEISRKELKALTESAKIIYVEDQEPSLPSWDPQDGYCTYFRRFCGWEPDSENEIRKQSQRYNPFVPGNNEFLRGIDATALQALDLRLEAQDAAIRVQSFYRSYIIRQKWKFSVFKIVDRLRREIQRQQNSIINDESMLKDFRAMLRAGFTASKLSGKGKLKTVSLKLVIKPETEECYLKWEPSRKKKPKLKLYEISQVLALTDSNLHPNITCRKSLIINCKSLSDGKMILQLPTVKERDLLVKGFYKLLDDCGRHRRTVNSTIDSTPGVDLKSKSRVLLFFNDDSCATKEYLAIQTGNPQDFDEEEQQQLNLPVAAVAKRQSVTKSPPPSSSLENFYQTRFDTIPTTDHQNLVEDSEQSRLLQEEESISEIYRRRVL